MNNKNINRNSDKVSLKNKGIDQLNLLNRNISRKDLGESYTFLNAFSNILSKAATSSLLNNRATQDSYIGLEASLIGITKNENSQGVMGLSFSNLINTLSLAIESHLIGKDQELKMPYLLAFIKSSFLIFITLESQNKINTLNNTEEASLNELTSELIFNVLVNSKFIQNLYKKNLISIGVHSEQQEIGSALIGNTALLMIALTMTKGDTKKLLSVIEDQELFIQEEIEKALSRINLSQMNNNSSIALTQASIAIKNKDYSGFLNILEGFMKNEGFPLENLIADIAYVKTKLAPLIDLANTNNNNPLLLQSVQVA